MTRERTGRGRPHRAIVHMVLKLGPPSLWAPYMPLHMKASRVSARVLFGAARRGGGRVMASVLAVIVVRTCGMPDHIGAAPTDTPREWNIMNWPCLQ